MHYCRVEIQGLVLEECGKPASVKIGGRWYCEFHADALEKALARWVDPDWLACPACGWRRLYGLLALPPILPGKRGN
jgi:hypothetical protein